MQATVLFNMAWFIARAVPHIEFAARMGIIQSSSGTKDPGVCSGLHSVQRRHLENAAIVTTGSDSDCKYGNEQHRQRQRQRRPRRSEMSLRARCNRQSCQVLTVDGSGAMYFMSQRRVSRLTSFIRCFPRSAPRAIPRPHCPNRALRIAGTPSTVVAKKLAFRADLLPEPGPRPGPIVQCRKRDRPRLKPSSRGSPSTFTCRRRH